MKNKRGLYKPAHLKKVQVAFRLDPRILAVLREQSNQAAALEAALVSHLKIHTPNRANTRKKPMSYTTTQCDNCGVTTTNQPTGDGCHACLNGTMIEPKQPTL